MTLTESLNGMKKNIEPNCYLLCPDCKKVTNAYTPDISIKRTFIICDTCKNQIECVCGFSDGSPFDYSLLKQDEKKFYISLKSNFYYLHG